MSDSRDSAAILDSISELFIAADREWRVTYVNRRARQYLHVLGMRSRSVIGEVLWDALPFLQGTPFHTAALKALARGTEVEIEAQIAPLDRWFVSRIVPTPDGSVSYSRDVTDRHLAEETARRSSELIRAVISNTTDAIFAKDRAGRYVLANEATAQVMGRRADEVVGLRDADIFPPDAARRLEEHDQAVLADDQARTYEETVPGPGGPRVFQVQKSPFRDASGRSTGTLGIARDVTEQRLVEAEIRRLNHDLEERVAELRTLLDVIPVGIGVAMDGEAREIRVNPAFAVMLGIEPGTNPSLTGPDAPLMRYRVLRDGRELAPEELPIQRAARGASIGGEEIDIVRADGSRSVLLCHASPLFDERGAPRGAVAAFLDVTGRLREERAQRVLSEASGLLNSTLELDATLSSIAQMAVPGFADACFVDLIQDGTLERVEIACEDPALRDRLLALGRQHAPALPDEDHSVARAVRMGRPVLAREVTPESRRRAARSPDHLEFLEAVAADSLISAPMVALGEVLGALTFCFIGSGRRYDEADMPVARELADRAAMAVVNARLYRAARSELARRARAEADVARWGLIFQHAGWGVGIASSDGTHFESVNPAFARMHGFEPDELVGQPLDLVTAPGSRHLILRNALVARERGRVVFETRHVTSDGAEFPVLMDLTAVRGDDGALLCLAANVQDLTERERAEAQVRQAQKMEALGRLAGGVAHDFNNVLMIIIGFADFLCASMEGEDPRRVDAEEIRKAAERAAGLTRQLLAFGRPRLTERQSVDLNGVVRDMELMLRSMLGEHIRLETALQEGAVGMDADRGQVEQILMNLALNARDAMADGGRLSISTRTVAFEGDEGYRATGIELPPGEYVILSVADSGHGMDMATRARIFEPFFSTRRSAHNSGLGLAVVYGIVTQNRGHVWVDSEPGRGTTFTLWFPTATETELVLPGGTEARALRGGTETLLVVEDEATVRALTLRVLADAGYAVISARTAEEALEVIRREPIDLVVSDVVMPGMGGGGLAERLAAERPALPIVFMSGYTGDEVARRGLAGDEDRFLQKPFAAENLLHKVRELLDAGIRDQGSGIRDQSEVTLRGGIEADSREG